MSRSGRLGWEASLPVQPIQPGRDSGNMTASRPPEKHVPAVASVQRALIEHLQQAYPILDAAIVSLIVEEQGGERIDEAVKTLSSLAADAEREAEKSREDKSQLQADSGDDKVAMEMAIAASLADQKAQHSSELWGSTTSEWESPSCWETTDPAIAAEWGSALSQSGKAVGEAVSQSASWDGGALWAPLPSASAASSSGLPLSQGKPDCLSSQAGSMQLDHAAGSGEDAMTALLGEGWASEKQSGPASGPGQVVPDEKEARAEGKTNARPYVPRMITKGGGNSPRLKEDRLQVPNMSVNVQNASEPDPEDDETQKLKQLRILFPELADADICRAYIDADCDVNRAAEALLNFEGVGHDSANGNTSAAMVSPLTVTSSDSGSPSHVEALGNGLSRILVAKPSIKEKKSESSSHEKQLQLSDPKTPTLRSNLVLSRQHPKLFQDDESPVEPSSSFSSRPVSPFGSTDSLSALSTPTHSSPETDGSRARARKKGKRKGKRSASSSRNNSEEEESVARSDMVDFMVSMLGGSVPHAVVKDVIENLKGDFQQSCKCLLSMSAGSEGGIIGEDFGAMTDGSESSGDSLRKAGLDAEENPLTELTTIFGSDNLETVEQVLKEKGGNVGDAATVLMAMFESEKETIDESSPISLQQSTDWTTDEGTSQDEEDVDPTIKINLEQLLAHFPLADKGAVRSLLHITNNSFEETAKMLYDSGLMPRGLDVPSLSSHGLPAQANGHHLDHQQPLQSQPNFRATVISPSYQDRGRPPGRPIAPYRQPALAHLQPIFRADEFPEIGVQSGPFRDAAEEGAPQLEGQNALFLKNRSATNKHWRACQYFFSEAARARANREFSRAEALKEKGRQHKRLAEAANQVASSKIFMEKNKTFRNTIKIDVHGQLVQEALKHVDDHLKTLSNLTTISYLSIITGRGLHSGNGKARILPAVQKFLRDRGYSFYQENPGCIVVDLKAERLVPSSGPLSADDADDRPSSAESFEERPGRLTDSGSGQALHKKLNLV